MAYGLKYTTYKQIGSTRYILNIYQKDWNYEQYGSFGIGTLTGFNLQIQGDQSSMMAPIIKTSANISLKDLFDKGTTQSGVTCILNGEKMGKWEEFFTRDPLKYRVDILVGNATIWSGYLTPDSWGEEMQYAGNINITARDMIGYLDEQEFDLTGRTTIQNLIQAAINKSQSSMAVSFKTTDCLYNTNGQSILASTIDASTFSGNTWYQALEKTLESLGLVLRYDGQGGFLVTSLRNQISYTHEYSTAVFTDRSGYRTLDPAVKQIVETFDPSIEPYIPADPAAESYTSNGATITQYITTEPISGGGSVQPPSHITNTFSGYTLAMPASGKGFAGQLAQPKLRTPKYGAPDRGMYLPTDVTSGQTAYYANPELKSPFILQFGLEGECLCEYGTALGPDLTPINIYKPVANDESHHSLSKIIIQVTARIGSVNYYLSADKAWEVGNSGVNIELAKDEELAVPLLDGGVDFNITIVKLETSHKNFNERTISNLVAPLLMTVSPAESHDLAGEYKTTTIYNTINRVEINRGPSIGSATCTRISLPMVKNILGYGNDIATDAWKFYGDANTFPLAVMIHAQIIVYYGQMEDSQGRETGNSIFTGNFIDSEQTPLVPATRYTYFGKTCTLLSGAYNFLTGGVDSATLREFFTWSSVWDTFNPTYSVKTSRNEGGTASAGGGGSASGGGGSTGGSVTSVDMSVPTGMTIGGNPITTRGTLALGLAAGYNFLTDTYKATLDGHLADRSSNPHNVTLAQAAGQSLADKLTALASWFEYDENNHAIRVKEYIGESQVKTSFYAYGEVTAGGIGSGGGGGSTFTAVAYANLAALTSEEMSKIPTAWAAKKLQDRIATLESITPNVSWGTEGADYVPLNVNGTTKNLLTAHQSLSGYATTSALAAHTGDTTIHITASERSAWNGKQDAIADLTTIRSNASNGNTAYGWGNHANAGYYKKYTYSLASGAGVRITYNSYTPVLVAVSRSNGGAQMILMGMGYGEGGTIRNSWNEIVHSNTYTWSIPNSESISNSVEVKNSTGNDATVTVLSLGSISFTSISELTTAATNAAPIHTGNWTSTINNTSLGAYPATNPNSYVDAAGAISACSGTYLPLVGGTMRLSTVSSFTIHKTTNSIGLIHFSYQNGDTATSMGFLGFNGADNPVFRKQNEGTIHSLYHTDNCNKTSVDWSASSLTLNGAISGATSITASGQISAGSLNTTGSTAIRFRNANSRYYSIEQGSSGIGLYDNTSGSVGYKMFIATSGNVGIGTTSPSYKLCVGSDSYNCLQLVRNNNSYGCGIAFGNLATDILASFGFDNTIASFSFDIGGTIYAKLNSSGFVCTGEITAGSSSDARFKDNQSALRNANAVLSALKPMEFDWNSLYHSLGGMNEGHDVGFLAQDVQPLIPSAIGKVYGDYLRLDYNKVTPYLVAGWQSHETEIDRLKKRVHELENRIAQLS